MIIQNSETPRFAPMDFLFEIINWFNANPIYIWLFSMLSSIMIIRFWRVALSPYCYFKDEDGHSFYLGRFVSQERDPDLPNFWKLMFKHNKITVVRSKQSFTELREHYYFSFGFIKYFSDIVFRATELGDTLKFPEKEFVNTIQNKIKYFFYRLISFLIPSTAISKKLYNTIEYKDKTARDGSTIYVESIEVLQHQLLFDKLRVLADVMYIELSIDNVQGKVETPKKKENLTIYENEDMRKDMVNIKKDSLHLDKIRIDIVPTKTLQDAIIKQDHIDNIKRLMDIKIADITNDYILLDKKYNKVREALSEFHRNFNSEIGNVAQRISEQTQGSPERMADIISMTLRGQKAGKDIRGIVASVVGAGDSEKQQLVEAYKIIAKENEDLKNQLSKFANIGGGNGGFNKIIIKDDFTKR